MQWILIVVDSIDVEYIKVYIPGLDSTWLDFGRFKKLANYFSFFFFYFVSTFIVRSTQLVVRIEWERELATARCFNKCYLFL